MTPNKSISAEEAQNRYPNPLRRPRHKRPSWLAFYHCTRALGPVRHVGLLWMARQGARQPEVWVTIRCCGCPGLCAGRNEDWVMSRDPGLVSQRQAVRAPGQLEVQIRGWLLL